MRYPLTLLALLGLGVSLHADVVPAVLFTNNAVLQREKPIPVWGTADAGEKVSVTFGGKTVATTADTAGKWRVDLPAQPANSTPADLVIAGKNTITLANVVVGEVWIASGQSNMEWSINNTFDKALDVPASAKFPLIRHIKIKKTVAEAPASTVIIDRNTWEVASPETTGNFSAVGYYFAKDLYELLNVPVGIIGSNWGGTPVESWISAEAYKTVPVEAAKVNERWTKALAEYPERKAAFDANVAALKAEQAAAKAANQPFTKQIPSPWNAPQGPGHPNTPMGLNNGMIAPLVPYALRGAIWYQGESNAGRASEYRALFSAMITGWRSQFAQGDFPFYWVQLANYQSPIDTAWAFLREAQTQTLSLPATGQAVIVDIGDVRDIHPRNKKDVGRRLARLALVRDYGFKIVDSGPVFEKAERKDSSFVVSFTKSDSGLNAPLNDLGGFELAGEDKVFKPAQAKIEGATVVVTSAEVPAPVAVRYAWRNAPLAGLFNKEGLPAVPFRSDSW
ncbi:sialate O-acetylesterase [Rariglobus hedericola]|uniref:Sialate O-acetylesterase n=1 Tax=Rariglobus hedericola TaxID=2597822 RepID=A0A556QJB9_9BACT|nr:sialate O-acetylesterase [Rariglobus hedericola]TSJ76740.1 sialate O-acetylesterase [Rariglobus hedericola]